MREREIRGINDNVVGAKHHALPSKPPSRSRSATLAYAVAGASLLFALLSTLQDITLDAELHAARERIVLLHARMNAQARASAEQSARVADLFAADGEHYSVPGGEIVRRDTRLYLAMRSLPRPPTGHVFQAWVLIQGTSTFAPSITFTLNRQGGAIVQLPVNAAHVSEVALSVQPEGRGTPFANPLFTQTVSPGKAP